MASPSPAFISRNFAHFTYHTTLTNTPPHQTRNRPATALAGPRAAVHDRGQLVEGVQYCRVPGAIPGLPRADARLLVLPPNAEAPRVRLGGRGDGAERAGVPGVDANHPRRARAGDARVGSPRTGHGGHRVDAGGQGDAADRVAADGDADCLILNSLVMLPGVLNRGLEVC